MKILMGLFSLVSTGVLATGVALSEPYAGMGLVFLVTSIICNFAVHLGATGSECLVKPQNDAGSVHDRLAS